MNKRVKLNNTIRYLATAISTVLILSMLISTFIEELEEELEDIDIFLSEFMWSWILFLVISIVAGTLFLWLIKKKVYVKILASTLIAFLAYMLREKIARGSQPIIRAFLLQVNKYYKTNATFGKYKNIELHEIGIFLIVVGFVFFVILLWGMTTKQRFLSIFTYIVMLLPVGLLLYSGKMPENLHGGMYIGGLVIYILIRRSDPSMNKRAYVLAFTALFLIVLMSSLSTAKVIEFKDEHRSDFESINNKIANIEKYAMEGDFEKVIQEIGVDDISKLANNMFNKGTSLGVSGDIGNLSSRNVNSTVRLEVIVDKQPMKNIYLKNFTAVKLEGNQWKAVDEDAFVGFYGKVPSEEALLNMQYDRAKNQWEDEFNPSYTMTVKNIAEKKDAFFETYLSYPKGKVKPVLDAYSKRKDNKDMVINFYENPYPVEKYSIASDYLVDGLNYTYVDDIEVKDILQYIYFAETYYTKGSDNDELEEEIKKMMENLDLEKSYFGGNQSVYELFWVDRVKDYVENQLFAGYKYTLNPGTAPNGENPLVYFLKDNKKGFCVHYATIATLACQQQGVPSRYVEGYMIPRSRFVEQEDGTYKAEVTDDMGHAWCEVLSSYDGWIKVEATPSYQNEMENVDAVSAENRQDNNDDNEEVITRPQETTTEAQEVETTTSLEQETTLQSEITTKDSTSEGKTKKDDIEENKEWIISKILKSKIFSCFVGILIMILIIWTQALIRRKNKYRKFADRKNKKTIILIYNSIVKLHNLTYGQDKILNEDEKNEIMKKDFNMITEDEWTWMFQIANEAAFSQKTIDKEAYIKMEKYYRKVRKKIIENLNIIKKIKLYFVLAM